MKIFCVYLIFSLLFVSIALCISRQDIIRTPKRFPSQHKTISATHGDLFCSVENITGACIHATKCAKEGGRVIGFCKRNNNVCCNVMKTCNQESTSHATTFHNPSYPKNDTEAATCSLTLHVGEDICAVRMENEVFEMTKYYKDMCPINTLVVLGTKETSSPLCGNMTGWATTFEVEPYAKITLAMILQKSHSYRFYTSLQMLPCSHIQKLQSPENSGMINIDAIKYIPTTTTTTPKPTKPPPENETTTLLNDVTTTEQSDTTTTNDSSEDSSSEITTTRTSQRVNFFYRDIIHNFLRARDLPLLPNLQREGRRIKQKKYLKAVSDIEEYFDPTPDSYFKKIFNIRAVDECQSASDLEDGPSNFPDLPLGRNDFDDQCWFYDPESGSYKVNDNCELNPESNIYEPSYRVIGGKFTNINEYPWQVGLIYKKKFFCGGALISDRFVVTASHCLFGSFSSGIHNLRVALGDHDLRTVEETESKSIGVKRVIWNLHFGTIDTDNDIGLLELLEPVDFSYGVAPVNLPTDLSNMYNGQNATITGWGRYSLKSRKTSPILKEYTSTVDDIDNCVKRWKRYPKVSAKKAMHICLNVTYGTPCHGDSGGPLVTCSQSNRCTLIGVVSFGFPLCKNVGLPAVFTRITTYKRWIDINTSPLSFDDLY